jgi:hypothetical protein
MTIERYLAQSTIAVQDNDEAQQKAPAGKRSLDLYYMYT